MGNTTSKTDNTKKEGDGKINISSEDMSEELKPKTISQLIDYIATYYILTMDFQSLRKLYEKEYCDKLVILTSDIIERFFTPMEITYLDERIKDGISHFDEKHEKMVFYNSDRIDKYDVHSHTKKKQMCVGIAKFYIKVAHIFAAIVTTINPVFIYKDADGNKVKTGMLDKKKIPKEADREVVKMGICDSRIRALHGKSNILDVHDNNTGVKIKPKVCGFNTNKEGETKHLDEESGIPELMELYMDDEFNYDTGRFTKMSAKSEEAYKRDLKRFFETFSDEKFDENEIKRFSDIKLRDYKNSSKCKGEKPLLDSTVEDTLENELFAKYAENLREMIDKTNKNQQQLIAIMNDLFVYTINPQTKKRQIRINPSLTEKNIDAIIVQTRNIIIHLYLTCEVDYTNGIKIYEAIVEQKIVDTAQNQIENLRHTADKLRDQAVEGEVIDLQQGQQMPAPQAPVPVPVPVPIVVEPA